MTGGCWNLERKFVGKIDDYFDYIDIFDIIEKKQLRHMANPP